MLKKHLYKFILSIALLLLPAIICAFDVVGVGASGVDILARVEEEALNNFNGSKGDSTLVSWDEYEEIVKFIPEEKKHVITGGSCSNTIKGLASLGQKTAYCTHLGNDPFSQYYLNVIRSLDITPYFTSSDKPIQRVISLITPDSQRSMFCYLGATEDFSCDHVNLESLRKTRLVYTEGYVLYNDNLIQMVIKTAKENGALVAFDLSSPRVIKTFEKEILELLSNGIDILFANEEEALLLTGLSPKESCEALAKLCPLVIVKVGKDGCWVSSKEKTFYCAGYPAIAIDTTGAGDLFAAGFLHAYLEGYSLPTCGDFGNRVGSQAVRVIGGELPMEVWNSLRY